MLQKLFFILIEQSRPKGMMITVLFIKGLLHKIAIAVYVIVTILIHAAAIVCTIFFIGFLTGTVLDWNYDLTKSATKPGVYSEPVIKAQLFDESAEKTYYCIIFDDQGIEYIDEMFPVNAKTSETKFTHQMRSKIRTKLRQHTDDHEFLRVDYYSIDGDIYIFCQLNVNWFCPSYLYKWDNDIDDLVLLQSWDSVTVTGIAAADNPD